jgi:hypothetical protein
MCGALLPAGPAGADSSQLLPRGAEQQSPAVSQSAGVTSAVGKAWAEADAELNAQPESEAEAEAESGAKATTGQLQRLVCAWRDAGKQEAAEAAEALLVPTEEHMRASGQPAEALPSSAVAKTLLAVEQEKQLKVGGQRGIWQSVLPACLPARLHACLPACLAPSPHCAIRRCTAVAAPRAGQERHGAAPAVEHCGGGGPRCD